MLRLLTALLAGLFVGGLGLEIFTDTAGISWIWPTVLPFLILSLTLTAIGSAMRGVTPAMKPESAAALLAQNLGALARITSVTSTGTRVNDVPLYELNLVVAPYDGDAFTAKVRTLVDPLNAVRFQPGAVLTVVRLKPGGTAVTLVAEPDAEWQRRMREDAHRIPSTAVTPETPDEPGRKPIIGFGAKGRGVRRLAYLGLFAVGIAGVGVPNQQGVAAAIDAYRIGDDYDDYVNGDRQDAAVAGLAEVVGGTEFIEVTFHADGEYPGMVTAKAPSKPGAATIDSYLFRANTATRDEHPPSQPENPKRLLFDVGKVDLSAVDDLAEQTRELTGIAAPGSETVTLAREEFPAEDEVGEPRFGVHVSDKYYSGTVYFDLDGEVTLMSGGAPGSKSAKSAD